MMMETVVYSREYLFVKELYDKGELGRIQFLRGSHQQDMAGWPGYWEGLPPMHYATHCVSPCLAILRQARRARRLPRLGPDRREPDPQVRQPVRHRDGHVQDQGHRRLRRGHPQPVQRRPAVPRELRRLRRARRASSGSRSRARSRSSTPSACPSPRSPGACQVPDYAHLLPEPIQRFTTKGVYEPRRSSTSRSPRAAATAARTRTWSTPGSAPSRASAPPCPTPRPRPTGRWSASAPTSRR